ncbi:MAG TPA: DUF86 domain-containing protein [Candidatus Absconditabacterales bacterium]|nr:DUF86 domain-containing protein [Candidatus Absconditabacterales bacterium]HMT27080.1 DUF86 domain-containing protein [Candidatus Absconditabacterales bacterium]
MTHHNENLEGLLRLILGCCNDISSYINGYTHASFTKDKKTFDACMMMLQVIGEICKTIITKYTEFDKGAYQKIIGLRNIISHDYFGIDRDEIRGICKNRIPHLEKEISSFLKK